MRSKAVNMLVKLAMLAAVSILLVWLVHFPIIPQLGFLEYDMADVPILIGAFMFGPLPGLLLTLVVCVLQGVLISSASGVIGVVMHLLATGGFVLTAGLIYHRFHTLKGALIALGAGAAVMIAIMVPLNYFISPMFLMNDAMDYSTAQAMIWDNMWLFVAFNSIKAILNALLTFLLYKAVSRIFKKEFIHVK